MTLTDLFLNFLDSVESERITASEQLIYIHLLRRGNVRRFDEWFYFSDRELAEKTKLSKATITEAKNRLRQRGYISIKTNGRQATQYKITDRAESRAEGRAEGRDNNRVESSKEKSSKVTPLPPKGKGDAFSKYTDNPELLSALKDFEAMRKAIKKPMQESTKGRMLKTLDRLASDDETKIAILNQSTDHNWQGLFELKRNAVSVGSTQGKATREDEEPECGTPAWEEWCRKKDLELFEQFQRGIANG